VRVGTGVGITVEEAARRMDKMKRLCSLPKRKGEVTSANDASRREEG